MVYFDTEHGVTEMEYTAKRLLNDISINTKKTENQYRKTGMAYNIFKVAGISEKEVRICKVLADLLDPKGQHYQGNIYLKLFMDMVANPHIKKLVSFDLSRAKITTEYLINEDRRIDIVIDDGVVFIAIEVKINAGEQEKQLADYAAFSRKMNTKSGSIPVLFLTPDGRESEDASKEDYISISFGKHIIPWLVKCLNLEETDRAAPIREILKQFIKAVKSFCGYMEDEEMENAINALVAESRDSYMAALRVSEAINSDALNFDMKALEIFKGQIYNLVKSKIHEIEYIENEEEDWWYFAIPIGKDCTLSINYDLQSISVDSENFKKTLSAETADKIRKTMSQLTGVRNEEWEGSVWVTTCAKFPDIINSENADIYKYDLYQVYSKNSKAVVDWIVSMAIELKKVGGKE